MKTFEPAYLQSLAIPNHLFSVIRQLGEHKGRQALYQKQASEIAGYRDVLNTIHQNHKSISSSGPGPHIFWASCWRPIRSSKIGFSRFQPVLEPRRI